MPNRFERVAGSDPERVTVVLRTVSARGSAGVVIGPAATGYRLGDDDTLSVDKALAVGCTLANRYGLEVVVVDDAGLWPSRWGELVSRA